METPDVVSIAKARVLIDSGTARTVRTAAGLSLRQMASALNVDPSSVYRWETGERKPRGERAVAYAALLRDLMEIR